MRKVYRYRHRFARMIAVSDRRRVIRQNGDGGFPPFFLNPFKNALNQPAIQIFNALDLQWQILFMSGFIGGFHMNVNKSTSSSAFNAASAFPSKLVS